MPVERTRTDHIVSRPAFEAASAEVLAALAASPGGGLRLDSLAARFSGVGPPVLEEIILRAREAGRLRVEGGAVVLVRADQERRRAETESALAARLAESLRRGGFAPPELAAEAAPGEVRRAINHLVRENLVVRTYDRVQKREVLFHREAVEAARRILTPHLASGEGLLVKEVGALLGASRKYSVPLLEHFDAVQFTRRSGDRRVLGPGARN